MCWQICLFMNLTCKRYCMEYRAVSVCTVIAHNHYWSDTVQLVVILIFRCLLYTSPVRAAFIAAPKALKSYFGTGLFAIVIHPLTFYCSPFFLDMSTSVSYTHLLYREVLNLHFASPPVH